MNFSSFVVLKKHVIKARVTIRYVNKKTLTAPKLLIYLVFEHKVEKWSKFPTNAISTIDDRGTNGLLEFSFFFIIRIV